MPAETAGTAAAAVQGGAAPAAPPPRRLGLALAVIATPQLMVVLDLNIVTVALPHVQAALGFSGSELPDHPSRPAAWICARAAAGRAADRIVLVIRPGNLRWRRGPG